MPSVRANNIDLRAHNASGGGATRFPLKRGLFFARPRPTSLDRSYRRLSARDALGQEEGDDREHGENRER